MQTAGQQQPISHANVRNRNLVILRAGDGSLHQTWLASSGGTRNWDLHISYFGKKGAPPACDAEYITWSQDDDKSKWAGVASALSRDQFNLDDYDYVAVPDDDVIMTAATLSRAFDMAREYDLAACQMSLHHGSYFGSPHTLRIPGLKMHYVSRVELMVPILRMDVFKRIIPYLRMPNNLWAMDHIVGALAGNKPRSIAVLDEVSALHTRTFWSSSMYTAMQLDSEGLLRAERECLANAGFGYIDLRSSGGLTRSGKYVPRVWWSPIGSQAAKIRRRLRALIPGLQRIASLVDGRVVVMRRMKGAEGLEINYERATGLKRPAFMFII